MDVSLDTILLAVGPNDNERLDALGRAVLQVAIPTDSTVVLTHVFTPDQFRSAAEQLEMPNISPQEVDSLLDRHETIRRLKKRFEEYDVEYEIRGVVGGISDGIVDIAEKTDADRVVVSGRSRSAVGKAVFGSTAQDVLLNSPCPVTFIRSQDPVES